MIDDDTRVGILKIDDNIVLHEDDDILLLQPAGLEDLVGVAVAELDEDC